MEYTFSEDKYSAFARILYGKMTYCYTLCFVLHILPVSSYFIQHRNHLFLAWHNIFHASVSYTIWHHLFHTRSGTICSIQDLTPSFPYTTSHLPTIHDSIPSGPYTTMHPTPIHESTQLDTWLINLK